LQSPNFEPESETSDDDFDREENEGSSKGVVNSSNIIMRQPNVIMNNLSQIGE
jgi:hypothetical protein